MSQQNSQAHEPCSHKFVTGVLIQEMEEEVLLFDPRRQQTHLVSGLLARLVLRISKAKARLSPLDEEEIVLLRSLVDSGLVEELSGPGNPTLSRRKLLLAGTGLAISVTLPIPAAASSSLCSAISCRRGRNAFRCNCQDGSSGVLCSSRPCGHASIAQAHRRFCRGRGGTSTLECCPC